MYCINCGEKVTRQQQFCIRCGRNILPSREDAEGFYKPRKIWKNILLTIFLTSLFWFFYYYGFVDKSNEATNVISHLIETVGRQNQAWTKSEQLLEYINEAVSEDCINTEGCIDSVLTAMTALRSEIDKENVEINSLWSENFINQNFERFFSSLSGDNQTKIMDIVEIYFPDETDVLEESAKLL